MAAHLQSRGLTSFGKRFFSQISSATSPSLSLLSRRAVHLSVYDKNTEEQAQPNVVPDDVIPPQPDKYWAPHPQTGVFGPVSEDNPPAGGERGYHTSAESASEDSVLEQKAFFRPLENLEKPPPHP